MEKRVLVYQSYGSLDIAKQTMFSVCSLLRNCKQKDIFEIQIFTEEEEAFKTFFKDFSNIKIKPITLELIEQLKGPLSFVHRVKVELLLAVSKGFEGPIFYCDSDTIFISDPTSLISKVSDRVSLMHTNEGIIAEGRDPLSKKIAKFLRNKTFDVGGENLVVTPEIEMWNAGFIGLSHLNKNLLPKILELTDRLYSLYRKHIMEQLAFSFFLQSQSKIGSADKNILHYWSQKREYQESINSFLNFFPSAKDAINNFHFWRQPKVAARGAHPLFNTKIKQIFKNMFSA